MKINVSNPNNLPTIDYRELHQLQGELKTLTKDNYSKLKNSIITKGFIIPFFTWYDKTAKKTWLLDGHQRLTVIMAEKMQPYNLPQLSIEAKNLVDAKEKLMVITSQYGTITEEGLLEFIKGLPDEFIRASAQFDALPNIFEDAQFKEVAFQVQTNRGQDKTGFDKSAESHLNNTIRQIVLYYDQETHKKLLERLEAIGTKMNIQEDLSAVVLKLAEYYEKNGKIQQTEQIKQLPKIYTFYYDRTDATTSAALKGIPHTVIFHDEKKKEAFKKISTGKLLATGLPRGLAKQRNKALKLSKKGEWLIFCSDDFEKVTGVKPSMIKQLKPADSSEVEGFDKLITKNELTMAELMDLTLYLINKAEASGASMVGFASNENPFYLKKKYRYKGLVDGRFYAIKNEGILFDEEIQTIDDHDISAAYQAAGKKVIVLNWVCPRFGRYKAGGYGTLKDREAQKIKDCKRLMERYPGVFKFKVKPGQHKESHIVFS